MKGGERMEDRIQKLLEKQLELLSEQSKDPGRTDELPALTMSMCAVIRLLIENRSLGA